MDQGFPSSVPQDFQLPPSPLKPGAKIIEVSPDDPDLVHGPPTRPAAPGMGQTGRMIEVSPDAVSTVDAAGISHEDPARDPIINPPGQPPSFIPESARTPLSVQHQRAKTAIPPPPTRPGMEDPRHIGNLLPRVADAAQYVLPSAGASALGTAGAEIGLGVGGPVGGFVGGVLGSVAGGVAGQSAAMGAEAATGRPPTREEVASRLTTEAATSALGEGAFRAGTGVVKKVGNLLHGRPAADAAETLALTGGHALPSQISADATPQMLDRLIAGGWLSRGAQEAELSAGQKMIDRRLEQEVRSFLPSKAAMHPRPGAGPAPHMNEEWLGKVTQGAQAAADKRTFAPLSAEYDAIKDAAGQQNLHVDFTNVRDQAKAALSESLTKVAGAGTGQETLAAASKLGAPPEAKQIGSILGPDGDEVLKVLSEPQAQPISVEQAMGYISDLGNVAQVAKEQGDRKLQRNLLKLKASVEDAIESTLKAGDQDLYTRWRTVSSQYKAATETFRNDFMRKFAKADPTMAAQALLTDAPSLSVEQIRRNKANLGGTWKAVQAAAAERVLSDSQGNWKSGTEIAKSLAKLGDERTAALFDQASGGMWSLARKIEKLQEPLTKEGSLYLVLKQGAATGAVAGAATAVLTGNPVAGGATALGTSAAVLLTPLAVAKLMYSPTGRALLLRGEVTPEALRILRGVAQVGAHAVSEAGQALSAPPTRPAQSPPTRPQ